MTASFAAGTPLWEPSEEVKQKANVTQYIQWLAREKGLTLQATAPKGVVCMTGMLGNEWSLANFEPMMIPSSVKLTTYQSETLDMSTAVSALQEYVTGVEHGTYTVRLDRVFKFDEIVEAHRYMESNAATGKLVVLVD
jgi:NADPH2:quinone reductase